MTGKYELRLIGALVGPIWWPSGAICGKTIRVDLGDLTERMNAGRVVFRDLLLHVMSTEGGDFQSCEFTEDTQIVVTSRRRAGDRMIVASRHWPITAFPSVKDMVKPGAFAGDYDD